jgi:hypothetical protein
VAFPLQPPLWVPVTEIEYVKAAAGWEVGWMETVEVWPELQLTGVGFDAGDPKMLDSNVTVPLAFSPLGQATVTLEGLPLAYAPSVRTGTVTAVAKPTAKPSRTILLTVGRMEPPLFAVKSGVSTLPVLVEGWQCSQAR